MSRDGGKELARVVVIRLGMVVRRCLGMVSEGLG